MPAGLKDRLGADVGDVIVVCLEEALHNGDEIEFTPDAALAQGLQIEEVEEVVLTLLKYYERLKLIEKQKVVGTMLAEEAEQMIFYLIGNYVFSLLQIIQLLISVNLYR